LNVPGYRNELIDSAIGSHIPTLQEWAQKTHKDRLNPSTLPGKINVELIPDIPHRRKTIANVRSSIRDANPLRNTVTAAQDQIITLKIKGPDRRGIKGRQ